MALMKASEAAREGKKVLARTDSRGHAGVLPRSWAAVRSRPRVPPSRRKAGISKIWISSKQMKPLPPKRARRTRTWVGAPARSTSRGRDRARASDRRIGRARAVTLLHEREKRNAKKGLATLCIGGGMGTAMCLERRSVFSAAGHDPGRTDSGSGRRTHPARKRTTQK